MRALIRSKGETVTENDGIVGIDWDTGAPLTNVSWAGGPYRLVQDYAKIADTEIEFVIQERGAGVEHANTPAPETVTYGGKEYTLEELKKLIG